MLQILNSEWNQKQNYEKIWFVWRIMKLIQVQKYKMTWTYNEYESNITI